MQHKNQKAPHFYAPTELSALPFDTPPENCTELLNVYGTYNIQPTANTENFFPAIAQGLKKQKSEKEHKKR